MVSKRDNKCYFFYKPLELIFSFIFISNKLSTSSFIFSRPSKPTYTPNPGLRDLGKLKYSTEPTNPNVTHVQTIPSEKVFSNDFLLYTLLKAETKKDNAAPWSGGLLIYSSNVNSLSASIFYCKPKHFIISREHDLQ